MPVASRGVGEAGNLALLVVLIVLVVLDHAGRGAEQAAGGKRQTRGLLDILTEPIPQSSKAE